MTPVARGLVPRRSLHGPWNAERTERAIGALLRGGLFLSATIVAIGGALYLTRHGTAAPVYGSFLGEPAELRQVSGILGAALAGRGRGLIQLGLLLLIATPIARVAFAAVAFALERDRLYTAIAALVLAILVVSLMTGVG
ncbi:MAG: DUF1634 domain-containing protein [Deltaproteobacteria bacterium]|nr:DUF1634 domain-containing protein [Deltaproteobacteria bacterium]